MRWRLLLPLVAVAVALGVFLVLGPGAPPHGNESIYIVDGAVYNASGKVNLKEHHLIFRDAGWATLLSAALAPTISGATLVRRRRR